MDMHKRALLLGQSSYGAFRLDTAYHITLLCLGNEKGGAEWEGEILEEV